jgi:myo-inositol-1(or 4)-monophosphatase
VSLEERDANADLDLASSLVREAGALAAKMRLEGLSVSAKSSITDVVTDADHAAEALIVDRLVQERPADGVQGEEGAASPGRRTWVIDPVDGTYNFVSGLPAWCSAIALTDGDELVLGAIYQPTTDEMWAGGPAIATTLNGGPLPPLLDRPLAEVSLATYLHPPRLNQSKLRDPLLRAVSGAAVLRIVGSGSIELASVAAGRIGVYLHANTHPWDWLPGAALVRGAGGVAEVFFAGGIRWHAAGNAQAVVDVRAAIEG